MIPFLPKVPVYLDIPLFLGHLHPLLVHLPIGFILLALLLEGAGLLKNGESLRAAVPFTLLASWIGATLACLTGWILSANGDYDDHTLGLHKWMGLTIPFLSFFAWMVRIKRIRITFLTDPRSHFYLLLGLTGILSMAGHLGATLTHGPDYLSLNTLLDTQKKKHPATGLKEALVFEDLVQPMLDKKCGSCHNSTKRKGGLTMESLRSLEKGGKHGAVIVYGQPLASEMVKRISLDPGDKKFMPSDGKPPLSQEETALLKWWIEKIAGRGDRKWSDLTAADRVPAPIKSYAESCFGQVSATGSSANTGDSLPKVPPVLPETLHKLKQEGFVIKWIDRNPDLLDVKSPPALQSKPANGSGPGLSHPADSGKWNPLLAIRDNIVWLDLSGNNLHDEQMEWLPQCRNIRILKLDKNPVTDKGIGKLRGMEQVQSLNLYNTRITKACLKDLSTMKNLRTVYVWGTDFSKTDIPPAGSLFFRIVAGIGPQN